LIRSMANHVEQRDAARFLEVVETELLALHEGNIARYKLRPSEYKDWQQIWN
jgi:hypothetical protein